MTRQQLEYKEAIHLRKKISQSRLIQYETYLTNPLYSYFKARNPTVSTTEILDFLLPICFPGRLGTFGTASPDGNCMGYALLKSAGIHIPAKISTKKKIVNILRRALDPIAELMNPAITSDSRRYMVEEHAAALSYLAQVNIIIGCDSRLEPLPNMLQVTADPNDDRYTTDKGTFVIFPDLPQLDHKSGNPELDRQEDNTLRRLRDNFLLRSE
jgi:hypothetical protein